MQSSIKYIIDRWTIIKIVQNYNYLQYFFSDILKILFVTIVPVPHPSNQVLSYWNLMLYNFFPSCFIIGLRVPNNEMSTINLILRMIATG